MGIGCPDATGGKLVDVRRRDFGCRVVAGDIAVAKVIREDKNDVRFVKRCAHLATDSTLGAERLTRISAVVFLSGRCVIQTGRLMEHL